MNTTEKAKQELKLYMAYKMERVRRTECREVIRRIMPKSPEQSVLLDDMIKNGELLEYGSGQNITYALPAWQYLDLLWDITPSDVERFSRPFNQHKSHRYYWGTSRAELRDFLLAWKFNNRFLPYDWFDIDQNYLLPLIMSHIALHREWSKILQSIDYNIGIVIAEEGQSEVSKILDVESIATYKHNVVDAMVDNPSAYKAEVRATYLLFSHILTGRIAELANIQPSTTRHYFATQAIYFQYTKDNTKAVAAWRKVIKEEGVKGELMTNPLYSLLYVKALSKDAKQTSMNRLVKVDKFVQSLDAKLHMATHILLDMLNERSCTRYVEFITKSWEWLSPLDFVLSVMVIRHYNIAKLPSEVVEAAEEWINHDEFLLLQAEASASFPNYIAKRDELRTKIGYDPIFERYVEIEPWQKSLNDLGDMLAANNIKSSGNKATTSNDSRIIYLLDDYNNFTPRLQISKSGTSWSKGRNIALSTLQSNGCEGMTTVDKEVATCVKCYDTWSGRTYTLSGTKVFRALVGHPLVFCWSNPDVSISIVGDSPYIKVESHKGGFKVSSNVEDLRAQATKSVDAPPPSSHLRLT